MNHCSVKLTMPMLTWSLDAEGFHFNGLEMRYVDGVLQIGDTYFNDNTMQSQTYYHDLVKQ